MTFFHFRSDGLVATSTRWHKIPSLRRDKAQSSTVTKSLWMCITKTLRKNDDGAMKTTWAERGMVLWWKLFCEFSGRVHSLQQAAHFWRHMTLWCFGSASASISVDLESSALWVCDVFAHGWTHLGMKQFPALEWFWDGSEVNNHCSALQQIWIHIILSWLLHVERCCTHRHF